MKARPDRSMKIVCNSTVCTCLLSILAMAGCWRDNRSHDLNKIQSNIESKVNQSDEIEKAFRDLPKMIFIDRRIPSTEITRQLNSWLAKQPVDSTWMSSRLTEGLPDLISRSHWVTRLGDKSFSEPQAEFMFQCTLMRDIAKWVLVQPYRDNLFSDWLKEKKESLSAEEGTRLENALKLFDWTIRNVTMDGQPKDIESLPDSPYLPISDTALGYTQTPWQTTMSARGDALARARVFSQLAFQEGIPVAWIALSGGSNERYKLWALAIPVGTDLYLLEPRLGIPLPGRDQRGVATLAEAISDASILRRASLVDQFAYPVAASDLGKVFLAMDVEPFALSYPMSILEKSLTGSLRTKLSANVDHWSEEFKRAAPGLEVQLWSLPWLSIDYCTNLRGRLRTMDQFTATYMANMGVYMEDSLVSRARLKHFAGQFESGIDNDGALMQYMGLRMDDDTIGKIPIDAELRQQLMIRRNRDENDEQFLNRIRFFQAAFRRAKLEGCLFLSMAHFDLGNYESSRSWADRWMLQVPGTDVWHSACWYLIARCLENEGKIDEAVEYYKKSPSAQEAGNRIRARLLRR